MVASEMGRVARHSNSGASQMLSRQLGPGGVWSEGPFGTSGRCPTTFELSGAHPRPPSPHRDAAAQAHASIRLSFQYAVGSPSEVRPRADLGFVWWRLPGSAIPGASKDPGTSKDSGTSKHRGHPSILGILTTAVSPPAPRGIVATARVLPSIERSLRPSQHKGPPRTPSAY